jgi:hypothetical protein
VLVDVLLGERGSNGRWWWPSIFQNENDKNDGATMAVAMGMATRGKILNSTVDKNN